MIILALSEAAKTTIADAVIWFVAFPALMTALIGVALYLTYREWMDNQENRRYPPL
jgi:hypothetical protein